MKKTKWGEWAWWTPPHKLYKTWLLWPLTWDENTTMLNIMNIALMNWMLKMTIERFQTTTWMVDNLQTLKSVASASNYLTSNVLILKKTIRIHLHVLWYLHWDGAGTLWRHQMQTFSADRVTDPLWGECTGHQASDVERWYFLWSAPEQTVEQSIKTSVIRYTIALITTPL